VFELSLRLVNASFAEVEYMLLDPANLIACGTICSAPLSCP
jgi:hypothetical protein